MTPRLFLKILLFLIPAIGGSLYLFWRQTPEQIVLSRTHGFFELFEKKAVSTSTPQENAAALADYLAPGFEIEGPSPIPNGAYTASELGRQLLHFQSAIFTCGIEHAEQSIELVDESTGLFRADMDATVALNPQNKRSYSYHAELTWKKSGEEWLLYRLKLSSR